MNTLRDEAPPFDVSEQAPVVLEPGALLAGTFRLVRPLGNGRMGTVVLARDEALERDVAIKLIRPDLLGNTDAKRRFLAEAKAMARVRDRNVVEIFTLGESNETPFIVMEYVPGQTLQARLEQAAGGVLPLDDALETLDQVCRGVEAIHASGAVHRDLKPSNVLIDPSNRHAVADLGLARPIDLGSNDRPELAGTPAYIAPEVITRQKQSPVLAPRSDVYSLGVLAYQLLAGAVPFKSSDALTLFSMHVMQPPRPLHELRPDLPLDLEEVVLRALEKEPEARIESAGALRQAFARIRERLSRGEPALRFLVADDSDLAQRAVQMALEDAFPGCSVETVDNGEKALAAMVQRPPSVAILDLHMPKLTGAQVIDAVRARTELPRMPVLVMSAMASGNDWHALYEIGADAFLMKPFEIDQLVASINALLRKPRMASMLPPPSVGR